MLDQIANLSGTTLPEGLEESLKDLVDSEDVRIVICLPNARPPEVKGCNPSGVVTLVNDSLAADTSLLPENMFSVIAAFEILEPVSLSAEQLSRQLEAKASSIAAAFGEGPTLDCFNVYGLRKTIGRDAKIWAPTLGGGMWTISEQKINKYERKYFITVEVPRLKLSENFHDYVDAQVARLDGPMGSTLPMKQVYESTEYNICTRAAERNVCKVAAVIADALQLKIKTLPDLAALKDDPRQQIPVATFRTLRNHLYCATLHQENVVGERVRTNSESALAIYHEAGSMRASSSVAMLPLSPLEGIAVFNRSDNTAAHAIPASVGIRKATRTITPAERQHIDARFFWPEKSSRMLPARLQAEYKDEQSFLALDFIQNRDSRVLLKPLVTYISE